MSAYRYAHARGADWRRCVEACAGQLGAPGGGLGFAYFTEPLVPHAADVLAALRERTGVHDWIGTVGIGILATGAEYLDEPALATMVADLPGDAYQVFSGRSGVLRGVDAYFGVIHADPDTPDVAGLIADMSTKVTSGYLVGGLSSAREKSVQLANDVLSGGLSGALLSASVGVRTRLTQGYAALPGRYRVTAGEANVIATLDGRPALEVMKAAIGEMLARDLRRAAQFIQVGLPVALQVVPGDADSAGPRLLPDGRPHDLPAHFHLARARGLRARSRARRDVPARRRSHRNPVSRAARTRRRR